MKLSVWQKYFNPTNYGRLNADKEVEVAIIGGGITGVSAAEALSSRGVKVALIEKERLGLSSTGHSTGNLYGAVDEILVQVKQKFGAEVARNVIASRHEAMDLIAHNVAKYGLDCDFKHTPWHYFSYNEAQLGKIDKAYQAARELGMDVEHTHLRGLAPALRGLRFNDAAQFNPLRYVQGLAKVLDDKYCQIYELTEVEEIEASEEGVLLRTDCGFVIRAKHLIHASHTPKGINHFHTQVAPYREYAIAAKIRTTYPQGVYFGYYPHVDEIISTRLYEREGERFLICVGGPHKVGHGDHEAHLKALENFLRQHFEVSDVTHRWSAQNYRSVDLLPYIGQIESNPNIYVATGFATHGLTYGVVAAKLISDLIVDGASSYADIYRPSRFTPLKSASSFVKENLDVVAQLVKDYAFVNQDGPFFDVDVGQGEVIKSDGHVLAVYHQDHESFKICSAVCSHMGCVVHWNNVEGSWDCPCHGSRFDTTGAVLEGPALKGLKTYDELLGRMELESMQDKKRTDQKHVMDDEELLDQASIESFPASDSPGYISKSKIDRDQHVS